MRYLLLFLLLAGGLRAQESPVDHLPAHIRQLTGFGERPDWSHDGKRLVFVGKTFGDVYEYNLETGFIRCLSLHYKHYGYTRVLYLANGDLLLAGPIASYDMTDPAARELARHECWLSVLPADGSGPPVPLGVKCSEGPAVSRSRLRIAWAELWRQNPQRLQVGESVIWVADIVYDTAGKPRLHRERVVFDSREMPFSMHSLETQNFVAPADTQLTLSVYRIGGGNNTDAYLLDIGSGRYRDLTFSPDSYDEPEGIFPDGRYTLVEHGPSTHHPWPAIDLVKVPLDGSGTLQRLTFFMDYAGYKASQGIISEDGKWMAFQIGRFGDEAGAGYGIFLYDLSKAPK